MHNFKKLDFPLWRTYRLWAAVKELRVRYRVHVERTNDVGAQPLGSLIGHFDSVLQYSHREVGRGVTGQPQAEVWVSGIWIQLLSENQSAASENF